MEPLSLALCLCLQLGAAPSDAWLAEDKWKHFFASFAVTTLSASAARTAGLGMEESAWTGAGTGAAVGVWKEWRDRGREGETASLKDLAWDLGGVGAGTAVLLQAR